MFPFPRLSPVGLLFLFVFARSIFSDFPSDTLLPYSFAIPYRDLLFVLA
jgi:hypothetical protein